MPASFSVGDIVRADNRPSWGQGKISELFPTRAVVRFKIPKKPKKAGRCDYCDSQMLSVNGGTGEIVCMRSGCGHDHGFEERSESFSFGYLVNIAEVKREEERARFRDQLEAMLTQKVREKILTAVEKHKILDILY